MLFSLSIFPFFSTISLYCFFVLRGKKHNFKTKERELPIPEYSLVTILLPNQLENSCISVNCYFSSQSSSPCGDIMQNHGRFTITHHLLHISIIFVTSLVGVCHVGKNGEAMKQLINAAATDSNRK
jgi:hypothetical protein